MLARLRQAFVEIVCAVYPFCFAEWLFQITKPSFLSLLTRGESLQVLLISPLYLLVPLVPLQAVVEVTWSLAPRGLRARVAWPSALLPAAVHSATVLLLADNFAYTVFGVGVVSLTGALRYVFAALWLAVFCTIVGRRSHRLRRALGAPATARLPYRGAVVLVALTLVLTAIHAVATGPAAALTLTATRRDRPLPDILFISMDGTEAAHTSLYGYERATTPFLDRLAASSLVFENAFSNNCYTSGALLSLLAGQRPTDFRVFYPPMSLQGVHAYQHLPGVLRALGYRSAQIATRYWASALWQGMRNAFDQVNGADTRSQELRLVPAAVADRFPSQRQFLIQTRTRVMERARHLLGVEDMPQYMDVVRNLVPKGDMNDAQRAANAIAFLGEETDRPAFVQVHLMKGHCCFYILPPEQQKFSRPTATGPAPTRIDRYDDAIGAMDADLGEILTWLEQNGRLDDTLIVVTSDHSMQWQTRARVPLLIRFPDGAHRGRVSANVQLADVAPTVLDYLGIPIPAWMTGVSLLRAADLGPLRPIISASNVEKAAFRMPKPPLYGLLSISAAVCDRWYELTLATGELETAPIAGHTAPCDPHDHPAAEAMKELLAAHLTARGFVLPAWRVATPETRTRP